MANLTITDNEALGNLVVDSVDDLSNVTPHQFEDKTSRATNKHKSATPGGLEDFVGHYVLLRCR